MVHHVIHHHPSEIPIWKIGMVSVVGCSNCHALLEGREHAVAHTINLQIENEDINANVTYQVTRQK